jgi:hypothetical protein
LRALAAARSPQEGREKPVADRARWLFRDHSQPARRQLRAYYRSLEARFGPLDRVTHASAHAETLMWWAFIRASEAMAKSEKKRDEGRGRRPSLRAIERLMKRQGLAFGSYSQALDKLRELAASRRNGHKAALSPEGILAQVRRELSGG